MPLLQLDTKAVKDYSKQLQAISKTAMPRVVRNTLNAAAFDLKKTTMPKQASTEFVQRRPQFFKVASSVKPAQGMVISGMKSETGFRQIAGDTGRAVDDLKEQEYGGKIGGRTFIALSQARASQSWHRSVKKNLRMAALENLIDSADNVKGRNDEEKFTLSAIHAGRGKLVLGNKKNKRGNRQVFLIKSTKRVGKDTKVNAIPVYSMKKGRSVKVDKTGFMEKATMQTGNKLQMLFELEAQKRIKFGRK